MSCDDKIRIARRLDDLGVAFIEGGWPGSNPKDVEFFQRAATIPWKHAAIASFGSTCRVGGDPATDPNVIALLDARTPVCTVVGKTSLLHVREVLRTEPEENLRIIEQSIAYLAAQGRRVFYDAEHFFDGYTRGCGLCVPHAQGGVQGRCGSGDPLRYKRRQSAVGHRNRGPRRSARRCSGYARASIATTTVNVPSATLWPLSVPDARRCRERSTATANGAATRT